jgi:hypothetical protein
MNKIFFILMGISMTLLPTVSLAHSGRTDSSGGHNCRTGSCAGTYHYHNGGSSYKKTTTSTPKTSYTKTQTKARCHPNYSGCVPMASDVDCAGGSGDGPKYVRGPVRVIGHDVYRLDRDGDGIGCE